MAKQLAFTNPVTGASYPEAYWRPTQINLNFADQSAHVLFQAYVSQAARLAGFNPIPGAEVVYDLFDANTFQIYFGDSGATANIRSVAYAMADATKDVARVAPEDNSVSMHSFFENAVDLL